MMNADIFSEVGFKPELRPVFERLRECIESEQGCGGHVYKCPNMREVRGAHVAPGATGRKRAVGVFVWIQPRKNSIYLYRPYSRRLGRSREEREIELKSDFRDWPDLRKRLSEWCLDRKPHSKGRTEIEFGDGKALPGGLPETNRARF